MAQLELNNLTLIWTGTHAEFSSEGIPVTVGFYEINKLTLKSTPSLSVCRDKFYALRIGIPDLATESPGLFLGHNGNVQPPTEVDGVLSSNGLLQFQVLQRGPVLLNREFKGQLNTATGLYKLKSSDDWESVGYSQGLPVLLTSCKDCGCRPSQTCQESGICKDGILSCPKSVPCGYNGGKCPGGCAQNGYTCRRVNGSFTCVAESGLGTNFWIWLGVIIFFLIIILIMIICIDRNSRKK